MKRENWSCLHNQTSTTFELILTAHSAFPLSLHFQTHMQEAHILKDFGFFQRTFCFWRFYNFCMVKYFWVFIILFSWLFFNQLWGTYLPLDCQDGKPAHLKRSFTLIKSCNNLLALFAWCLLPPFFYFLYPNMWLLPPPPPPPSPLEFIPEACCSAS